MVTIQLNLIIVQVLLVVLALGPYPSEVTSTAVTALVVSFIRV